MFSSFFAGHQHLAQNRIPKKPYRLQSLKALAAAYENPTDGEDQLQQLNTSPNNEQEDRNHICRIFSRRNSGQDRKCLPEPGESYKGHRQSGSGLSKAFLQRQNYSFQGDYFSLSVGI